VENDLISVIVPVYKVEKYLEKCVDSIVRQTYHNIEIILVDDGSPDTCPQLCDEWEKRDSRIKVIHKENGGLSSARNAGLDIVKGAYIVFVDSDDYIADNMVERLYSALKEHNADMSLCGFTYIDESNQPVEDMNSKLHTSDEVISGREAVKLLLSKYNWYYTIAWCKLYRTELFQDIRFPVGKIHEDEFISHLIFDKCKKVSCISDRLYFYLQREDSIMGKNFNRLNIRELDAVEAFVRRALFLESVGINEQIKYYYLRAINNFVDIYFYNLNCSAKEYARIKEIHRCFRKNIHLCKYCSGKNKVHVMLICISPKLHRFVINTISFRHKIA
jgi:glycosyltransferase involved in cell wall biosynthesis